MIEFTNRQLTFVVGLVVLATLVVAVLGRRQVGLAVLRPRASRPRRCSAASPC